MHVPNLVEIYRGVFFQALSTWKRDISAKSQIRYFQDYYAFTILCTTVSWESTIEVFVQKWIEPNSFPLDRLATQRPRSVNSKPSGSQHDPLRNPLQHPVQVTESLQLSDCLSVYLSPPPSTTTPRVSLFELGGLQPHRLPLPLHNRGGSGSTGLPDLLHLYGFLSNIVRITRRFADCFFSSSVVRL